MINRFSKLVEIGDRIQVLNKQKIFCIGLNKTGTTSLKKVMQEFGYVCGKQSKGEALIYDWARRDFKKIIHYCYSAQFFQDLPFSLPYTYVSLDQAFPNSKFILTIRENPEVWYKSLTNFHAKMWGRDRRIPTKEDLQNACYGKKGRPWEANRIIYKTPENDPYNKDELIDFYIQHNKNVMEYFRHRVEDLLILNVANNNAFPKLCDFLGLEKEERSFPWENKTNK